MSLPAPNLDDRRFQDLVDDAKRHVQRHCPEWTDHNVSDPGVTLIETFAMAVDQLLYRLNRVPDRLYVRFLELLGVTLFPPAAAEVDVTFWLAAPRPEPVVVPEGTEVLTARTETQDPVVFTTATALAIVPSELAWVATEGGGEQVDRTDQLDAGSQFPCFTAAPVAGDALLLGLREPAPSCAVALRFTCDVEGVGVDPRQPPLVWEAWTGAGWAACELERDETGGLNRPGDVVVHVPAGHTSSAILRHRAAWLRCRVVDAEPGQPFYSASPRVGGVTAFTVGGTVRAVHGEHVRDEVLGVSDGVPGQRFRVAERPVADCGEDVVVVTGEGDGAEWARVGHFAESGPDDRHFTLDAMTGDVEFGPAVRGEDGTVRQYGAVPPRGAYVRVRSYRTGGGRRGNVARESILFMRSTLPFVRGVTNRKAATGGADGEDVENAKLRGPMLLRTRQRAVTAEDYEYLALEASRGVARVRCVPADAADPSVVRVLVVPELPADPRVPFAALRPADELLETVTRHLDARRLVGTRLVVEPPFYQGVTVVAQVRARPRTDPAALRERALDALYRYLHPLAGGPDGTGWPFGRPVQAGEIFAVLQRLPGADLVEEIRLYPADLRTGERHDEVPRVDVDPNALVFSYEHQVLATPQ
ncbi:MAG TPA: putative baseplate assembly protein [Mycobacteriales bacterium]|nr:putative baseplate assembly protein [Mycobacteriales bacterium]